MPYLFSTVRSTSSGIHTLDFEIGRSDGHTSSASLTVRAIGDLSKSAVNVITHNEDKPPEDKITSKTLSFGSNDKVSLEISSGQKLTVKGKPFMGDKFFAPEQTMLLLKSERAVKYVSGVYKQDGSFEASIGVASLGLKMNVPKEDFQIRLIVGDARAEKSISW